MFLPCAVLCAISSFYFFFSYTQFFRKASPTYHFRFFVVARSVVKQRSRKIISGNGVTRGEELTGAAIGCERLEIPNRKERTQSSPRRIKKGVQSCTSRAGDVRTRKRGRVGRCKGVVKNPIGPLCVGVPGPREPKRLRVSRGMAALDTGFSARFRRREKIRTWCPAAITGMPRMRFAPRVWCHLVCFVFLSRGGGGGGGVFAAVFAAVGSVGIALSNICGDIRRRGVL